MPGLIAIANRLGQFFFCASLKQCPKRNGYRFFVFLRKLQEIDFFVLIHSRESEKFPPIFEGLMLRGIRARSHMVGIAPHGWGSSSVLSL